MKKRVFIVHGWEGSPSEAWLQWLRGELEPLGFEVHIPALPESNLPRINKWIPALAKVVGMPDEQTYFVGHSLGNQAILRYLETLPEHVKIGGAVFVAGFIKKLTQIQPHEEETAKLWLETPIDLERVKMHLPKSVAIYSDNDPYVPLSNSEQFEKVLGSKIVIDSGKGHFTGVGEEEDNVVELPSALQAVLDLADLT